MKDEAGRAVSREDRARGTNADELQWGAFVVVCIVFLLANSAFSATPVLFSAYLNERHFAMSIAGIIATGESTGLAIGSTLSVRFIRGADVNLRSIVLWILSVLIVVQLLSAYCQSALPFGIVRLASGVCVGIVQSIGSAWIAPLKNSERLFAIYIAMTFLGGTVGIPFFSFTLRHAGLSGSFLVFAALIALAGFVALRYPRRLEASTPQEPSGDIGQPLARLRSTLGLLLISVVINFTFNGGLWTFLDQIGQRAGIQPAHISFILGIGMFTALGVTALAGVVGNRLGRLRPLLFAHACLLVSSLILLWPSLLPFAAAVMIFHVGLALISPYYLASLAAIEPAQHSVLCGVAAMNIGFSIGPWVVSVLVDAAGYAAALAVAAALFGAGLLLVLLAGGGKMSGLGIRQPYQD